MDPNKPIECELTGCGVLRRTVNNWYIVEKTESGAHIHQWGKCPKEAMETGKHFCGLNHAFLHASKLLTQDTTVADRESTLELKPPLTREGIATQTE